MPDDVPRTPGAGADQPPQADRLRQLLARATEEQVNEQRAVSSVLADMRQQLVGLHDGVRQSASDAAVERLSGIVSTVVADVRTSTTLLGQRLESLARRVEQVANESSGPAEQTSVRLAALAGEIADQSAVLGRLQASVEVVAQFPAALTALQGDVAGLHDRVAPLAEVRATLGDLGARTVSGLDALRPQLERLQRSVEASGVSPDPDVLRTSLVEALSGRLERLEAAAERPVIGPDALRAQLGDLRVGIDRAVGDRVGGLTATLTAVDGRLAELGGRLSEVGDAAGGVPAVATDVARLVARVDELQGLHDRLETVGRGVVALQGTDTSGVVVAAVAELREDVEAIHDRLDKTVPPPIEVLATAVSSRVADRLVETLAPRLADVVLTRVSVALTNQLGDALSVRMRDETAEMVRTAEQDSERRILAHVDESLLALAEALLRRRRTTGRVSGHGDGSDDLEPAPAAPNADATVLDSTALDSTAPEAALPVPESGHSSVDTPYEPPVATLDDSIETAEVGEHDTAGLAEDSVPAELTDAAEEPALEEPASEEPASEEPAPEEASLEEPVLQEPELELEEPVLEEPSPLAQAEVLVADVAEPAPELASAEPVAATDEEGETVEAQPDEAAVAPQDADAVTVEADAGPVQADDEVEPVVALSEADEAEDVEEPVLEPAAESGEPGDLGDEQADEALGAAQAPAPMRATVLAVRPAQAPRITGEPAPPPPAVGSPDRLRPLTRATRGPLLEPTPDLDDDEVPLTAAMARPRPAPAPRPRAVPPAAGSPPPAPAAEPDGQDDDHAGRRKPWWRPGG